MYMRGNIRARVLTRYRWGVRGILVLSARLLRTLRAADACVAAGFRLLPPATDGGAARALASMSSSKLSSSSMFYRAWSRWCDVWRQSKCMCERTCMGSGQRWACMRLRTREAQCAGGRWAGAR